MLLKNAYAENISRQIDDVLRQGMYAFFLIVPVAPEVLRYTKLTQEEISDELKKATEIKLGELLMDRI